MSARGREFLNKSFVAVNTLYVSDFTKNAQGLKKIDINLFKNTKAPQSAPSFQSENSIWILSIFRRFIYSYVKMNEAYQRERELPSLARLRNHTQKATTT